MRGRVAAKNVGLLTFAKHPFGFRVGCNYRRRRVFDEVATPHGDVHWGNEMQTESSTPQPFVATSPVRDERQWSTDGLAVSGDSVNALSFEFETTARECFEWEVERAYLRAVRARAVVDSMPHVVHEADAKLVIGGAVQSDPMLSLAHRASLTDEQCDLVWSVVACSLDPRIVPHLEALGGAHARRGLSLATYALLARIDDASVMRMAEWLASSCPLVHAGLLQSTEQVSPAARAYVASPRLITFLNGKCTASDRHPVKVVRVDHTLLYDPQQSDTLDDQDHVCGQERDRGARRATRIWSLDRMRDSR